MPDLVTMGIGLIAFFIFGAIVLHIAAILTKISDASLGKALAVALIGAVLVQIFGLGGSWAAIIGLLLVIAVTKYVYDTSWVKAAVVWIVWLVLLIIIAYLLRSAGYAMRWLF
ncbi:MAG: hypothetical protein HXS46_15885 [Theionarchaea archaeon]|nr:hypothetical protein [Theionarchaea archaeon]